MPYTDFPGNQSEKKKKKNWVELFTWKEKHNNNLILKVIWRGKWPRRVNTILKEQNVVGGLMLSDFKTYYKSYSNQNSVILAKEETSRSIE